MAFIGRMAI